MKSGLTVFCVACACVVAATAGASPDGYYLYAPHPAGAEAPAASGEEGVLVKEITIKKGDTLSGISRSFSGRASYYPQILLFNQIANPNLIYAGKTLRVPVTKTAEKREKPARATLPRQTAARQTQAKPVQQPRPERKPASATAGKAPSAAPAEVKSEQQMYDKCLQAYHEGACDQALPLFEAFLREYPQSVHVPDVSLYRADCHFKLSGK